VTVTCPACNRKVPGQGALCQYCGARLEPPVPCKTCGHTISASLTKCPYCNAATDKAPPPAPVPVKAAAPPPPILAPALPASKAPVDLNIQKMRVDVGARIMWGEERQAIRKDLVAQGYPERSVDMALDDAAKERQVHFRKAGVSDIGTAIGCGVGFIVCLVLFIIVSKRVRHLPTLALLCTLMGVLPFAGLWFCVRGIRRIAGGGKGERDATDLDEDDIL